MSVLRPRDIQTRIRAGETPDDVAAAAQTTVEKIMGFATPVLAERAYQAQLAQRASVRRRAATGHVPNLGTAVTGHLETIGVAPESVEWDAWRREDGRWTVVAAYVAQGEHHQAAFAYDAAGRFVVAEDDEARALVGERTATAPDPGSASAEPEPSPHASPVTGVRPLDELWAPRSIQMPLGDDAIHLVTGVPAATEEQAPAASAQQESAAPVPSAVPETTELQGEVTIDLTETTTAVRNVSASSTGDADWIATQASERPAPADPPAPRPGDVPRSEPSDEPGDGGTVAGDAREEEAEQAGEALFEVPAGAKQPARAGRARGRASVPSWDEIMFGGPTSE